MRRVATRFGAHVAGSPHLIVLKSPKALWHAVQLCKWWPGRFVRRISHRVAEIGAVIMGVASNMQANVEIVLIAKHTSRERKAVVLRTLQRVHHGGHNCPACDLIIHVPFPLAPIGCAVAARRASLSPCNLVHK